MAGNYEFNPNDWVTINEVKIEDSYFKGSGLIIRAYKKVGDKFPRMGIREFYTDKDSGELKNGKQVRIDMKNMNKIFEGLKECYEKARAEQQG